ncbi:hypothetical protein P8452_47751 [Trifolium repens]|nr:hypothetical protein P8452_28623 [Trifolium repens]WJX62793.1 hypothetical protein P8452_47751 [Trifolium repens]
MPRRRPVSSDHETTPFEEGEEPIERLAEPCAINSFDIDQYNPLATVTNEMKNEEVIELCMLVKEIRKGNEGK